jgi:hypothetical protein
MSSLADALLVALGLATAGLMSLGVGSLVTALIDARAPLPLSTRFWLGVCGTLALLEPLHLFLPVAGVARGLVVMLALAGLWTQRHALAVLARQLSGWEWALLATGLAVMGRLSLGPGAAGDSSLYHYPAVRWAVSQPVVPGVGNLNPFLGYSHGHFLLLALVDAGPFAHRSHHLLNPLLVLVTGARCLREAARLSAPVVKVSAVVGTVALLPVLAALSSQWLVSPSPNLGEPMFVIVLVLELLAVLEATAARPAWVVWLLAVGAVVFKLTAAMVGVAAVVLVLRQTFALSRRARGWTVILGLTMGLSWLGAGAVRTGYLLYPLVLAPLPVDWRMDPAVPASVTRYISAYCKGTVNRLLAGEDDGAWWGPWLERALLDNELLVPTLCWVVCVALALVQPTARRRLGWLAPSTLGLLAWFLTSPDTQYLGAVLVLQTGMALGLVLDGHRRLVAAPVTLLLVAVVACVAPSLRVPKFPEGGLLPAPLYPSRLSPIRGGTVSQPDGLECGDDPVPCTALMEAGLGYRRPGELSAGFTVRDTRGELAPGLSSKWKIDRAFLLSSP